VTAKPALAEEVLPEVEVEAWPLVER